MISLVYVLTFAVSFIFLHSRRHIGQLQVHSVLLCKEAQLLLFSNISCFSAILTVTKDGAFVELSELLLLPLLKVADSFLLLLTGGIGVTVKIDFKSSIELDLSRLDVVCKVFSVSIRLYLLNETCLIT